MDNNILASDRILIRPILKGDTDAIHEYASDKSITMMMFLPNETREETESFVEYAVSEWNKDTINDREYVIVYEGNVIGGINLEYNDTKDACEIGWTVHKNYRNKGIATEAAKLLIEYAFNNLLIHKVTSHCDSANSASEKVMIKIGMTLVDNSGTRFYPKTGVTSGEYLYEITKEKYYQQKGIGDSSKISRCGDAKIEI
ncbi:MAG: GNAT family N-acetyltransferase [Lachnospiraceae bacterium]|nr:GNAT family N-acetyltransferase [Lachnospiraceae bacterium]